MWFGLATAFLLVFCGWALWSDLRERRIPNALTATTLAVGLALRVPFGLGAVGQGLAWATLAFGFGLLFFLFGGLGGGDVKLMAGLASFLDSEGMMIGVSVMAAVGVVMALVTVLRSGRLVPTLRNLLHFFLTFGRDSWKGWKGESPAVSLAKPQGSGGGSPYAVAIAAGAMAGWFVPLVGGIG